MLKFELMKQDEITRVSEFISRMNNVEEHHIGFCGTDSLEIAQSIKDEISYTESFITASYKEQLIGVVGFDPDFDSGIAEIWGPFIVKEYVTFVEDMWEEMLKIIPKEIQSIHLFPNKKNKVVHEIGEKYRFNKHTDQAILTFSKDSASKLLDSPITEISPEYYILMEQLHDNTFPGTYYSGKQIIDRLNEHNKVFIITEDEQLLGYIYVEAEPEYGEASIEFFGVDSSKRGKGFGKQLISGALQWLFSFESIDSITLCVSVENNHAIHLYQKVGFQLEHELYYFIKDLKERSSYEE